MSRQESKSRYAIQQKTGLGQVIKRTFDLVFSFLGLVVFLPVFLLLALIIFLDSGRPVLFVQTRIGLAGRSFKIYKFRTMIVDAEKKGAGLYLVKHDPRLTRVGNFLRRTSLDELPQLFNVLIGDQSFVGPRAMLPVLVDKLNDRQYQRHCVRPGITGLAQVKGRNSLTWSKRIDLDLYYIKHWSLWLDFSVLFQTMRVVLTSDGVIMDQVPQDVDDL